MAVTLASVDGTFVNPSTYDAGELRRADAALVSSAGVSSGLSVSVDGSDVVTVTAGSAIISGEDAVAGTGVYRAGIGAAVTGSLEARDATNARIDLVVFRQYDTDVVASHPRYASEIEIIKGTPSATPAVPTKPSMATELARITVPASGGGAATVDSSKRVYASAVSAANGIIVKTADQSVTSSTTLVSDSKLTAAIPAAGTYLIDLTLRVASGASSAGDMRIGATFPAGTCSVFVDALDVTLGAATNGTVSRQTADLSSGVDPSIGIGASASATVAKIRFVLTATAAGTFTFMWAQSVSNASATTVKAGSHMVVTRTA